MARANCLVVNAILCLVVKCVWSQSYVGDFCILESGASGQCQLMTNCPSAVTALQSNGKYPETCGFEGPNPIVCCPGYTPTFSAKPTTERTHTTEPNAIPPKIHREGEKSKKMCEEYQKYTMTTPSGSITSTHMDDGCEIGVTEFHDEGQARARPKEFPHMALIGFDNGSGGISWECSGSLISERFILTAASCVSKKDFTRAKYARLGELALNDDRDDAQPQDFLIEQLLVHPDYQPTSQRNDIALVKLNREPKFKKTGLKYIRPACLNTEAILTTERAVVSGWSRACSDRTYPMLKSILFYVVQKECNKHRGRSSDEIEDPSQICAVSYKKRPSDKFQGASGDPLQIPNRSTCTYEIVGVASSGERCSNGTPKIFTRVSNYIEWIEDRVWPD